MTPERLFAPVKENEWPSEIDDMKSSFADKLNVYRSMAHHPNLLRAIPGMVNNLNNFRKFAVRGHARKNQTTFF